MTVLLVVPPSVMWSPPAGAEQPKPFRLRVLARLTDIRAMAITENRVMFSVYRGWRAPAAPTSAFILLVAWRAPVKCAESGMLGECP
jgi:hypothetical protein